MSVLAQQESPKSKSFLLRCAFWIYYAFLKPYSANEDEARKEFIITIILFGTLCFLFLLGASFLWQQITAPNPDSEISPYAFFLISALFIALYILTRKGWYRWSSGILIVLYFFGTTYTVSRWGPDLGEVLLSYALIVVIAGILFNIRISAIITSAIAFSIIGIAFLNGKGAILFDGDWKKEPIQLNDMVQFSCTYFMIMFICWLSNREIDKSLARARRSEKELKEKNESLEAIVEDRTRELRKAQAEKISQLYHFAEFGRLSTGMFHDLMNPLTNLAHNITELEDPKRTDISMMKTSVDRAVKAGKKMGVFITAIKKQITIDSKPERMCLNSEIEEVISLFNYRATKAGVSIIFEAETLFYLEGSVARFHQIMTNLLSNALDACDDPSVSPKRKIVTISIHRDARHITIVVRDKGCGIESELLPKIFDPFFTTKSQHKGMGLGLSTTKEVTETYFGGTVHAASKPNEGTTFTITIPVQNSETPV